MCKFRILRTEKTQAVTSSNSSSALIGRTNDYRGNKGVESNSFKGHPNNQRSNLGGVVCYYCHKPGHTKRECRKLLSKGQRMPSLSVHVASTLDNLDKSITIFAEEFAKFQQYQESLRASSSTPITAIAETGNISKCLLSSTSKWVIDSGATDHMTGSYDETDYW
ncbi:uncharacterized protein LOC120077091 [Benincasa hispida]|uniref:uncharacterized protein LOC120077091 n=1 Tax=Benincasa hispida TaxID=102211 RepID=UPI001901A57A|nr:uncharacterized protein LOC120077091 [Benincasa hispida]